MESLCDILSKHGCDKNDRHSYGPVYEELFAPIRANAEWVMEIGTGEGGSLRAWRDYFVQAEIVGLDIEAKFAFREPRIRAMQYDQSRHDELTLFTRNNLIQWDVVIDDGSHDLVHQVMGCFWLWPYLKPGGLYVIEDVQYPDMIPCFASLAHSHVYDLRSVKGRYDDVLVVMRKP